ncbi:OsmC family protein [[Eubacterium] cellulosolvens]
MRISNASAVWENDLIHGKGLMKLGSGAFQGAYSYASRFEEGEGTNPEELIGAAHAGCFSMALAHGLAQAGYAPKRIETSAKVTLDKVITHIDLITKAEVPGIQEKEFSKHAEDAKVNCPVSQALRNVDIKLQSELVA